MDITFEQTIINAKTIHAIYRWNHLGFVPVNFLPVVHFLSKNLKKYINNSIFYKKLPNEHLVCNFFS